jgi:predicted phage tail protein
LARDRVDNKAVGGDSSGVVYEVDTGGTNGGSSLTWEPQSKSYTLDTPTVLKSFDELIIDADLGGLSTTVTVTTDLGRTDSFTLTEGGRVRHRRYLPTTMKGHSLDVKLSSSGTAARHWYGLGLNATATAEP